MNLLTQNQRQTLIKFNFIHLIVFLFCGILLLLSVFLGAQYIFRYHRYQLAKSKEESDSPLNTPHGSINSISCTARQNNSDNIDGRNMRAVSTSTLISEVVTFVKLKPKHSISVKHKKLRESIASEDNNDFENNQPNDNDSIGVYSK
jgi:hypothetical protein